jgi:hypothetical protein
MQADRGGRCIVPTPTVEKLGYRVSEVVAATGLNRNRVYELMAQGQLAYRQIGGVRIVPRSAIEALVEGGPDEAA